MNPTSVFGQSRYSVLGKQVEDQLRAFVFARGFPCLGARSAFTHRSYAFGIYERLDDEASLVQLSQDLETFARARYDLGHTFYTFIASFIEPRSIPEELWWDDHVWTALQRLHEKDHEAWDGRFSQQPKDPEFAFSFAGCGHLVVALYPGASRYARRFAWPTLVFNPLEQDAQNFPTEDEFLRFRDAIRSRDIALQGTVNPSLPPTLEDPQAPGFSGAQVPDSWECPLHVKPQRASGTASE